MVGKPYLIYSHTIRGKVLKQFLHVLAPMMRMQRSSLILPNFQVYQAKAPTPVAQPVTGKPVERATFVSPNNLSTAGRQLVSGAKEHVVSMTPSKVEATWEKDNKRLCIFYI